MEAAFNVPIPIAHQWTRGNCSSASKSTSSRATLDRQPNDESSRARLVMGATQWQRDGHQSASRGPSGWRNIAGDILNGFGWSSGRSKTEQQVSTSTKEKQAVDFGQETTTRQFVSDNEFNTMKGASFDEDLTAVEATISDVRHVDAGGDHMEIQVDISGTGLESGHTHPGQFVQMERRSSGVTRGGKRAFVTIANAPGRKTSFQFLVSKSSDPAGFAKLRKGETIRLSPVIGEGVDFGDVIGSPMLYIFVDCPQGLAAVRSLLEWNKFRAASGQGANRTTRVKLYYSTSGPAAVAYRSTFSEWMAYGVDVLPIYACTLLDHFGGVDVMREMGHLGNTMAFASVAAKETVEYLYRILSFGGIQRTAIKSFTQDRVSNEIVAFDYDPDWTPPTPVSKDPKRHRGIPDSFYEFQRMRQLEEEIWQEWVKIRDVLREEARAQMKRKPKYDPFNPNNATNKEQAWNAWFMHNESEWKQQLWEDDVWGGFYESWTTGQHTSEGSPDFRRGSSGYGTSTSWSDQANTNGADQSWGSQERAHWGAAGNSWYESKSQDYWDWVGRGTRGYGSAGASSQSKKSYTYEDMYGGSGSWGNVNNSGTKYEQGGYKHQWDPTGGQYKDTTSSQDSNRGYQQEAGAGKGWSGWNRSSKRQGQGRSSGSNYYSSFNKTTLKINLYSVLGVANNANGAEIKRAYRRAAMKWHPDRNPNSKEALAKMKEVVVAYSVLKDLGKRQDYDRYGIAK